MSFRPQNVLLVDDNAADRFLFSRAFAATGVRATLEELTDGLALLERLKDTSLPAPHLVFLDLNMPKLGGLDTLDQLRAIPSLRELPVVIMTGTGDPEEVRDCYMSGANAVVPKPLGIDNLQATVSAMTTFWLGVAHLPTKRRT